MEALRQPTIRVVAVIAEVGFQFPFAGCRVDGADPCPLCLLRVVGRRLAMRTCAMPPCHAFTAATLPLNVCGCRLSSKLTHRLQGVPERDTKQMIAYAQSANKVIIGPATVGGVQVRAGWGCVPYMAWCLASPWCMDARGI